MTAYEAGDPRDRRVGQALVLFGVSMLLVIFVGSTMQAISMPVGLALTELLLILLPAVLFVVWKKLPVATALGWKPVRPAVAVLSIAAGVSAWGVAAGIHELLRPLLGETPALPGLTPQTVPRLMLLLVCGAALPGFCEETLFRGVLQGVLSRRGSIRAVIVTSALFAVYHLSPWTLVPVFFLGLVFGMLAVRTGSTVPGMLAHMANNATAFVTAYVYRDQIGASMHVPMGVLAATAAVTFPALWVATARPRAPRPVLATAPAGLSRAMSWVAGIFIGVPAALIAAGMYALYLLISVHSAGEGLEPEIQTGAHVIVLRERFVKPDDIDPAAIVALRRDGVTVFRRVVRIDGDSLWIAEDDGETQIDRSEIAGKVILALKDG